MATFFTASLTGQQETPPNASQATGEGSVVWDPTAQVAVYNFTVHGLDFGPITGAGETTPSTADDVTNAHFHNAPPGVAGPVVFGQIGPAQDNDDLVIEHADSVVQNADGSWTLSGIWDTGDPANVPLSNFADLLSAAQPGSDVALYWNVHTTTFPAGEIRGQLVAAEPDQTEAFKGAVQDISEGVHDVEIGRIPEGLQDVYRGLTTALQFDLGPATEGVRGLQEGVHDLIIGNFEGIIPTRNFVDPLPDAAPAPSGSLGKRVSSNAGRYKRYPPRAARPPCRRPTYPVP
jgi:CHRD domain